MSDYNFNFGPVWFWKLILILAAIGALTVVILIIKFLCAHVSLH